MWACRNWKWARRQILMHSNRPTNHPLNNYGDMVIFPFFKMVAGGLRCITLPNFMKIGQAVVKILRFLQFSRWRPSAVLDLFSTLLDHPRRIFGGHYCYAKFGWNPCSSFHDMNLWIFCTFYLKTPIHTPKRRDDKPSKPPLSLGTRGPPYNTLITWPTPLTIQNGIWIQSTVLPQYTFRTDKPTNTHTDRQMG